MDARDKEYREMIGRGEEVELIDQETAERYPHLAELLVPRLSAKGYKLDPVQFTVRMGVRCAIVTVRDVNWAQTLTVCAPCLDDVWGSIDALLGTANPPWVPTAGRDPKLRKPRIPQ
jgi:hypothetical protein